MKIVKLEAIRGFAATYVVLHHMFALTELRDHLGPIWRFPFRFGQEAVILFILISGFVICLSSKKYDHATFKTYFVKRFVRIYPLAVCAFILSFIILKLNGEQFIKSDFLTLVGNLFMLQDSTNKPGYIVPPFLGNDPLWSLSYEWWFYMLYIPLLVGLSKIKTSISFPKIYIILLLSAVAWVHYLFVPNHISLIISYLVIWWSGVASAEVYLEKKGFLLKDMMPIFISLGIMALLTTIPIITFYFSGHINFSWIMYPIVTFRHFIFALVAMIGAFLWRNIKMDRFDFIVKASGKFAPISYGLYIIHMPIILWKIPGLSNIYLICLIKLMVIFILAYLLEKKLQPLINSIFFKKKK